MCQRKAPSENTLNVTIPPAMVNISLHIDRKRVNGRTLQYRHRSGKKSKAFKREETELELFFNSAFIPSYFT